MRSSKGEATLWVVESAEGAAAGRLPERLRALGFAVHSVRATGELAARLEGPAAAPRTVFLPTGLRDCALEASLRVLAPLLASGRTTGVAFGPEPPDPARRRRLAEAGLALGLFGAFDDGALRFQANRAFLRLRPRGRARRDLRAPFAGGVRVRAGGREKSARAYSLSAGGAFLETPRPSPRGARLEVELGLPGARAPLRAEVVHTNVPGNLARPFLPAGMGVRFEEPGAARAALEARVQERSAELVL